MHDTSLRAGGLRHRGRGRGRGLRVWHDQYRLVQNLGALPAGTRLPPIRQLAQDLELAPGTVAKAYALLDQTGIASSQRRRGTVARAVRLLNIDADTARRAVDRALS